MCVIWACQGKHLNMTTRTLYDDLSFPGDGMAFSDRLISQQLAEDKSAIGVYCQRTGLD
jgi:hypothetical protein